MLDWLAQERDSRCEDASGVFDAPETPAPLFAYRALKSVLFGTHDDYERDEVDKENIRLEDLSDRLKAPSRTRNAPQSLQPPPPVQTPPRQRPTPRRLLSPAKGILRTPGVPTPRRQNVSVKFKDAKASSATLNTGLGEAVASVTLVPQLVKEATVDNVVRPKASKGAAPQGPVIQPRTVSAEEVEIFYSVEDMDAYMASTEHEMKKLVRYGQRMREYARLTQKENALLKSELDGLREEAKSLGRTEQRQTSHGAQRKEEERNNGGLFDLAVLPSPPTSSMRKSLSAKGGGGLRTRLPQTATPSLGGPEQANPRKPKARSEGITASQDDEETKEAASAAAAVTKPEASAPAANPVMSPKLSVAEACDIRPAARTYLPPERVAAAKARLRLKSEQRKRTPMGAFEQVNAIKTNNSYGNNQEGQNASLIDWQNL